MVDTISSIETGQKVNPEAGKGSTLDQEATRIKEWIINPDNRDNRDRPGKFVHLGQIAFLQSKTDNPQIKQIKIDDAKDNAEKVIKKFTDHPNLLDPNDAEKKYQKAAADAHVLLGLMSVEEQLTQDHPDFAEMDTKFDAADGLIPDHRIVRMFRNTPTDLLRLNLQNLQQFQDIRQAEGHDLPWEQQYIKRATELAIQYQELQQTQVAAADTIQFPKINDSPTVELQKVPLPEPEPVWVESADQHSVAPAEPPATTLPRREKLSQPQRQPALDPDGWGSTGPSKFAREYAARAGKPLLTDTTLADSAPTTDIISTDQRDADLPASDATLATTPTPAEADTDTKTVDAIDDDPRFPRLAKLWPFSRRTRDTQEHQANVAPFTDQVARRVKNFDFIRYTLDSKIDIPETLITFPMLGVKDPKPNHLYYSIKQGRKTITIDGIGNIIDPGVDKLHKYAFSATFPKNDAESFINALKQGEDTASTALQILDKQERDLVETTTGVPPATLTPRFKIDVCEDRTKGLQPPKEKELDKKEKEHVDWMTNLKNLPSNPDLVTTAERKIIAATPPPTQETQPTDSLDDELRTIMTNSTIPTDAPVSPPTGFTPASESYSPPVLDPSGSRLPRRTPHEVSEIAEASYRRERTEGETSQERNVLTSPENREQLAEWRKNIADILQHTVSVTELGQHHATQFVPDGTSIAYSDLDSSSVENVFLTEHATNAQQIIDRFSLTTGVSSETAIFTATHAAGRTVEIGFYDLDEGSRALKYVFENNDSYLAFIDHLQTDLTMTIQLARMRLANAYDLEGKYNEINLPVQDPEATADKSILEENKRSYTEITTINTTAATDDTPLQMIAWDTQAPTESPHDTWGEELFREQTVPEEVQDLIDTLSERIHDDNFTPQERALITAIASIKDAMQRETAIHNLGLSINSATEHHLEKNFLRLGPEIFQLSDVEYDESRGAYIVKFNDNNIELTFENFLEVLNLPPMNFLTA